MNITEIALPDAWPNQVKSAMLHILSAAHYIKVYTRSWCANSKIARVRLIAKAEMLEEEVALLREELRIKDQRLKRIPAAHRPYYQPHERMAILELKAVRHWNASQTAQAFHVQPATIINWTHRIDEKGPNALVQTDTPVNKYPDLIRYVVKRLKVLIPWMGKVRKVQLLARCGLHLAATTIRRWEKENSGPVASKMTEYIEESQEAQRVMTAKYPNHLWHIDLTEMPTSQGFWTPWMPNALKQAFPFCYWIAFIVDHYSRRVMGFAVYKKQPTSLQIQTFLSRIIKNANACPKHLVCDRGGQFDNDSFRQWCRKTIKKKPRYGKAHKHGSIAVIERFIKSAKNEYLRNISIPLNMKEFRQQIQRYVRWYNAFRPHQTLDGATPFEKYCGETQAIQLPRYEPRKRWPKNSKCAAPQVPLKEAPGTKLKLLISYYQGDKRLPILHLKIVA